tara:strand:+ start:668 stop:862 length:195 start_codon:yes stop_codon:yes gene_type:complete
MIKIFNSAYGRNSDSREIPLSEVNIVSQKIDYNGAPYILFEHKDFPLGALMATFDGSYWACDLD